MIIIMKLYSNTVLYVRVGACVCALTVARVCACICMHDYYIKVLYMRAQCVRACVRMSVGTCVRMCM